MLVARVEKQRGNRPLRDELRGPEKHTHPVANRELKRDVTMSKEKKHFSPETARKLLDAAFEITSSGILVDTGLASKLIDGDFDQYAAFVDASGDKGSSRFSKKLLEEDANVPLAFPQEKAQLLLACGTVSEDGKTIVIDNDAYEEIMRSTAKWGSSENRLLMDVGEAQDSVKNHWQGNAKDYGAFCYWQQHTTVLDAKILKENATIEMAGAQITGGTADTALPKRETNRQK